MRMRWAWLMALFAVVAISCQNKGKEAPISVPSPTVSISPTNTLQPPIEEPIDEGYPIVDVIIDKSGYPAVDFEPNALQSVVSDVPDSTASTFELSADYTGTDILALPIDLPIETASQSCKHQANNQSYQTNCEYVSLDKQIDKIYIKLLVTESPEAAIEAYNQHIAPDFTNLDSVYDLENPLIIEPYGSTQFACYQAYQNRNLIACDKSGYEENRFYSIWVETTENGRMRDAYQTADLIAPPSP